MIQYDWVVPFKTCVLRSLNLSIYKNDTLDLERNIALEWQIRRDSQTVWRKFYTQAEIDTIFDERLLMSDLHHAENEIIKNIYDEYDWTTYFDVLDPGIKTRCFRCAKINPDGGIKCCDRHVDPDNEMVVCISCLRTVHTNRFILDLLKT